MESAASAVATRQDLLEQIASEVPIRSSWLARHFSSLAIGFQIGLDALTVLGALAISYKGYRLLGLGVGVYYPKDIYLFVSAAVAAAFILLMERYGLYRPSSSLLYVRETEAILRGSYWCMAIFFIAAWLFAKFILSRWILVLAFVLVLTLVISQRIIYYSILRRLHLAGYGIGRVLIYGASEPGVQVFRKLAQSPRLGLVPVAFVDDDPSLSGNRIFESSYTRRKSLVVAGTGRDLSETLSRLSINRVILADAACVESNFARISDVCRREGVKISFVPLQFHLDHHLLNYQELDGVMLAEMRPIEESKVYRVSKRLMDCIVGGLLTVAAAPFMVAIAVVIRIIDGPCIIFSQERVGQFGKTFRMYKFRTMHRDALAYDHTPRNSNDPRITRLGRFLRRTSLDELPQLINVICGDMSLVGPRPEMPFIVAKYTAAQRGRLAAKPGLTGLWQISADRAFEIHENIDYDLYYIRNRSILLDIVILLHTVIFAIRGTGAY